MRVRLLLLLGWAIASTGVEGVGVEDCGVWVSCWDGDGVEVMDELETAVRSDSGTAIAVLKRSSRLRLLARIKIEEHKDLPINHMNHPI